MENEILNDYCLFLGLEKKRSSATIVACRSDLSVFFRFIRHKLENLPLEQVDYLGIQNVTADQLNQIDKSFMDSYFAYLKDVRSNQSSTIRRKIIILRDFFEYLESLYLIDSNPLKNTAVPAYRKNPTTKALTLSQVNQLLNNISGTFAERDHALIMVLLTTGLKRSEVCSLRLEDDTGLYLRVRSVPPRRIPIIDVCRSALDLYKPLREVLYPESFLFLTVKNSGMNPRTVNYIVEKHLKNAGLSDHHFSINSLRFTAGKMLADQGVDLQTIAAILGYQSAASANHFVEEEDQVDLDNLTAVMSDNPLNKF